MAHHQFIRVDSLFLDEPNSSDFISVLSLNRPEFANALSAAMISEINAYLDEIQTTKNLRLLVLRGEGKHFCAGADLNDMKKSVQMSEEENRKEAEDLGRVFQKICELRIPSLALVRGAAYGGALGLVAACDFAIAQDTARFCLSELRLGLIPALIFPYLKSKIPLGFLNRLALAAHEFSALEALEIGLLARVLSEADWSSEVVKEIQALLRCGPAAHSRYLDLVSQDPQVGKSGLASTAAAIAEVRSLPEAQHGLASFFAKKVPNWSSTVDLSDLSRL